MLSSRHLSSRRIIDLEDQIVATDKEDIKIVYKGLLAGS
jgi:hypothetical protein